MITKIRNYIFDGVESFDLFGRQVAVFCFLVGVCIFMLFLLTGIEEGIAALGFFYILFAIGLNTLIILILSLILIINFNEMLFRIFLKTILIMLANIPIAFLFSLLGLKMMDLLREYRAFN